MDIACQPRQRPAAFPLVASTIESPRACGKTWTGRRFATSEVRFDEVETAWLRLEIEPASFLAGPTPRLLDEWHLAGGLWNAIRHACDDRAINGQFILTGSVDPARVRTDHSGAVLPVIEIPQSWSLKFLTLGWCGCSWSSCCGVLAVSGLVCSEAVAVSGDVEDDAAV